MPDSNQRAQLRQLDEETRAARRSWVVFAIVAIVTGAISIYIFIVLLFLLTGNNSLGTDIWGQRLERTGAMTTC